MQPSSSKQPLSNISDNSSGWTKPPRSILEGIFAFPPNRETLGGTAYFIVKKGENILLDCPAWDENNRQFLLAQGSVRWLILTHRGGIGKKVSQMQEALGCEVVIQEQEAYLLPEVKVTSFVQEFSKNCDRTLIWTPGHSPGSSCLYWNHHGGVLFTGRHLLPRSPEAIAPLRTAKTFHWFRQLRSVEALCSRFSPQTLNYIIPGANTGYLRGKGYIDNAYQRLSELDLEALRQEQATL